MQVQNRRDLDSEESSMFRCVRVRKMSPEQSELVSQNHISSDLEDFTRPNFKNETLALDIRRQNSLFSHVHSGSRNDKQRAKTQAVGTPEPHPPQD